MRLNSVVDVEEMILLEINITCMSGHTWLYHEDDKALLVFTFKK